MKLELFQVWGLERLLGRQFDNFKVRLAVEIALLLGIGKPHTSVVLLVGIGHGGLSFVGLGSTVVQTLKALVREERQRCDNAWVSGNQHKSLGYLTCVARGGARKGRMVV